MSGAVRLSCLAAFRMLDFADESVYRFLPGLFEPTTVMLVLVLLFLADLQ